MKKKKYIYFVHQNEHNKDGDMYIVGIVGSERTKATIKARQIKFSVAHTDICDQN